MKTFLIKTNIENLEIIIYFQYNNDIENFIENVKQLENIEKPIWLMILITKKYLKIFNFNKKSFNDFFKLINYGHCTYKLTENNEHITCYFINRKIIHDSDYIYTKTFEINEKFFW